MRANASRVPHSYDRLAYRAGKRLIDLLVSSIAIVVLSPVMAGVAIAIRLDSPGSALFRQVRLGRNLRPFTMVKFRTMVEDNDDSQHRAYMQAHIEGSSTTRKNTGEEDVYLLSDPRITRIGSFLRRTSFDEIPNLLNVARGEMSLVGPRPPIPYEVEMYGKRALGRMKVRPGMTGLAQVTGRGSLTFEQALNYDLDYIDRATTFLDLRILLRTVPAVFGRRGV